MSDTFISVKELGEWMTKFTTLQDEVCSAAKKWRDVHPELWVRTGTFLDDDLDAALSDVVAKLEVAEEEFKERLGSQ